LDITDQASPVFIGTYTQGSYLAAVITNTSSTRNIFASAEIITPTVKKISFRSINPTFNNYIIISHESLHKPGLTYSNPVKAYASYRASPEGGGYDTLVVNSSQLYNQFNYGETSARAIYQLLKFMNSGGQTKYLVLIGKGDNAGLGNNRARHLRIHAGESPSCPSHPDPVAHEGHKVTARVSDLCRLYRLHRTTT
jgi:hypothetical protein